MLKGIHQAQLSKNPFFTVHGKGKVQPLFDASPRPGKVLAIAPGIWWLRLPLSSALDHINVYALEDDEGWVLIDTGSNTTVCRAALEAALEKEPFVRNPIARVITTHYHPDHIGLLGLLCERGASLQTTQTCWLQSRLLQKEHRDFPCEEEIRFVQRIGIKGIELAAFCRQSPSHYTQMVMPIPFAYERIREGDTLKIGNRQWTIHVGYGHASEHATLWSDDGFVITGDQILPGISSNLSIHPSEPDADLVSEWVSSCMRFGQIAEDETICLPGHNIPFTGVAIRCQQLIASQEAVLNRLLDHLKRPYTAIECLETIYRRALKPHERYSLITETLAFLNHLYHRGLIRREIAEDQSYLWYRSNSCNLDTPLCFNPKTPNISSIL